jgi:enoyl-CoA hydratase/carnithine racemase
MIFNNPERHNAVSFDMWQAAARILDDFAKDDDVRVVVVTGAGGKAFVSGADISKFADERATREAVERYNIAVERIYSSIYTFPKPTIAAIQGYCVGGGLGLAVTCDLRFCTQDSRFALPAAKLGLGYGFAGLQRFINTIGPSHTKDVFFSARQFGADEAHRMGIVSRVLPEGELEAFVKDYAGTVAANAPLTVGAVKQITNEVLKPESERNLARAAELVARCFASQDYIEGRTAFLEKRKPNFSGK